MTKILSLLIFIFLFATCDIIQNNDNDKKIKSQKNIILALIATSNVVSPATTEQKLRGIYMVGGLTGLYTTPIASIDLFDPDTGNWYTGITSLPTPVSFAGIASEKSKIIVVGGFTSTGAVSKLTQVYDILTNTWSQKTVGPASSRSNMGVASFNGKVYFLGGTSVSSTTAWAGSAANDIYDVAGDSWTTGLAWGTAGSERGAFAINGVIYNNGGRTAAATMVTTHDGYLPSANTLTTGNTEVVLSAARTGHSIIAYNAASGAEMWSLGGATVLTGQAAAGVLAAGTTTFTASTLVQTLSAPFSAGATWASTPPQLPTATAFGSAVVDPRNGNVYFSGGNTVTTTPLVPVGSTTLIKTDMATKAAWTSLTALPTGRWGHKALIPNQ